jgi:glycosyltransferase involved in cell wall biosynthesis
MLWHLKRITRRLGILQPILCLYSPRQIDLIGHFGEKLACYFNYDELADFEGNERIRELLQEYDEAICRSVDVVFCTSESQFRRRKPLNAHTYFVPNGVDYPLYSSALYPATQIAPEVKELPRPIVGYVGWLGPHIDVDLLLSLSRAYIETSFVFVGPCASRRERSWRDLRSQPNVLFTGRKRRHELPGYLKAFDAVLMPDIAAAHRLAAYPLKLHEYLAAGRSIVATKLPELEPFQSVLRVVDSREEFVRILPEAIADNSLDRTRVRTELARRNSWDQRVVTINEVLHAHLSGEAAELKAAVNSHRYSLGAV